ncbi:prepilin-type N-terminal cleavage/methylation domain-containing protein [Uliginosibacterium sp. 31-16]|uniref:prepilin-type N-terminal cleavage/methylation domain-containing protein n=1 Tax=Uliginosibacterium sp. 31-16 TaxID=3068315 RepID=UPI0027401704|nr:prepilin-type N-terminal cleavage/methylation domain-containing protein [Uliginosibacterium sp. 31-16]MDP5240740.1 prepilin-type N-terminal cleavage/methylation domain-containing protein [Uliginosibacterium sp. 31-16]
MTTDLLSRQRGFSLVELMIALVLGLIVVGGSLAVFASQRVTMRLSGEMADVQADGRVVLDALARDLRTAGDFGCWPVSNPPISKLVNAAVFDETAGGLAGYDGPTSLPSASGPFGVATVRSAALDTNSDIVSISGVFGSLSQLKSGMTDQSAALVLKQPTQSFQANDVAVITDCVNWSKFQVTSVATDASAKTETLSHAAGGAGVGGGNKDPTLGEVFATGATVGRLDTVWWFIATQADGQKGLFRLSARDGVPILVSERVSAMVLLYDIDSDGDGVVDQADKTAADVSNWAQVRGVKAQLLMRSEKKAATAAGTGVFDGQSVPQDGRLYLPLQMNVALRNQ